jgi:hypothetical protein
MIGKTSTSFTTAGIELAAGGVAGKVQIQRASSPLTLVNLADDGAILNLYKATTNIGSIGTVGGDLAIYSTGETHAGLRFAINTYLPTNNAGAVIDATTNLGTSAYRYNDLYLSGTANANKYAHDGDSDTYFNFPAANQLSLVAGSAEIVRAYQIAGAYGVLRVNGSGSATYPNFTFNGDDNTGMYRATTDTLAFTTGGTERVRIDSAGDLTLKGGRIILRESDDGNDAVKLTRDADEGYLQLFSSGSQTVELRGNGNSYLNGGNVGIGAPAPTEKLEVDGGVKISNGNSRLYFGTEGGTSYRALEGSTNGSLLQVGENYTDIALQGKVGIGTTGPVSHLHIAAAPVGTNGAVAHILQNAATNGPTLLVEQTGGGGNQNVNQGLLIKVDGQNGGFGNALQVIGTNDNLNSGTDFNIITVKNGGNVGIGTDTPQHELVVYSTGNTTLGIVGAGYNDTLGIRFGGGDLANALGNGNSGAAILSTQSVVGGAAVGDLRFQVNTGDSLLTAVNILSTGNVELADGKPIVSETDVGTHFYTHLATGSFYQGTNQAVAINTNIPSHNVTGNNMFSISITGYSYDSTNGGIIDCNIGMYSGEGGFHNSSISGSNIPREWLGKIRVGYTSANKVVILLGDIDTGTNYELAVSCGVQGFYGVSSAFFTDWTMSAVTSLSAYGSTLVTIHQKTTQMIGFESYSTGFSKATGWSKVSNWGNSVEAYDFGGYLTNGRFTPLQPGMYQFSYGGWAAYNSSTGQERYAFAAAKNGGLQYLTGANYSAADSPLGGGTRTVYLNGSSDYVELWMYSSVATTVGGSSHYMWWQGHLLGASNSGQSWTI